jgi:hypothetical protein
MLPGHDNRIEGLAFETDEEGLHRVLYSGPVIGDGQ